MDYNFVYDFEIPNYFSQYIMKVESSYIYHLLTSYIQFKTVNSQYRKEGVDVEILDDREQTLPIELESLANSFNVKQVIKSIYELKKTDKIKYIKAKSKSGKYLIYSINNINKSSYFAITPLSMYNFDPEKYVGEVIIKASPFQRLDDPKIEYIVKKGSFEQKIRELTPEEEEIVRGEKGLQAIAPVDAPPIDNRFAKILGLDNAVQRFLFKSKTKKSKTKKTKTKTKKSKSKTKKSKSKKSKSKKSKSKNL